jgi:hypothetical protein
MTAPQQQRLENNECGRIGSVAMKARLATATIVGASVAIVLAILEAIWPNAFFEFLQVPGFLTIILAWGHGGAVSELVSAATMICVNALVYSVIFLGASMLFFRDKAK